MKRLLKWILILAVIAVAGGGIAVLTFVDSITRTAIEKGGSFALGVDTSLEKASIGLFSGEFALDGLVLANPEGFQTPYFLRMDHAGMGLSLRSILSDTIRVPELVLDGLDVHVERRKGKTNYGVILESLGRFESSEAGGGEEPAPGTRKVPEGEEAPGKGLWEGGGVAGGGGGGGGKAFVIDKVVIRNVTAHFDLLPIAGKLARAKVPIPEIVVDGVGQEMSLGELVSTIVKAVLGSVTRAGKGIVPDDLLQDLQGGLGSLKDVMARVKGNLGGSLDVLKNPSLESLQEKAGAVQEQIQEQVGGLQEKVGEIQKQVGGKAGKALGGVTEGLKKVQDKFGGLGGFLEGKKKKKQQRKEEPNKDQGGGRKE